ncbi:hypothetical protein FKM82_027100 [Ascaphus truei]
MVQGPLVQGGHGAGAPVVREVQGEGQLCQGGMVQGHLCKGESRRKQEDKSPCRRRWHGCRREKEVEMQVMRGGEGAGDETRRGLGPARRFAEGQRGRERRRVGGSGREEAQVDGAAESREGCPWQQGILARESRRGSGRDDASGGSGKERAARGGAESAQAWPWQGRAAERAHGRAAESAQAVPGRAERQRARRLSLAGLCLHTSFRFPQSRSELIAHLKDQLQEMKAKTGMEGKYVQKDTELQVSQTQKKCSIAESQLQTEFQKIKCRMDEEIRVHVEIENFLRQHQQELEEKLEYWMEKYDKDTEAKQAELTALKTSRANDLTLLQELAKQYKDFEKVIIEDRMEKEKTLLQKKQEKMELMSAIKLQAWWRGMMVRKGPKKTKSKKGKDKETKGKGKTGGKTKK